MARTLGNPNVKRKKFGNVQVTLNLFSGTYSFTPKNGHLTLDTPDRNKLVAWMWEELNGWDALGPTATPMTLRDKLFGRGK
jgi:hypothetical protein